ncbi:prepilin-type N-terminal cleavage/methylation domain-containing protein [Desulfoluna sp.]|uniref:prepilin-type N-terminal cleavage/methylation domain-containing protein n=1 Tax=Desulfoluna sp. TaxID=2045199 RepID=UPI00261D2BC0|nr:prepilin-type N-terminal cleavage/methylation domain-containing protein [Desulfoluna sp.]
MNESAKEKSLFHDQSGMTLIEVMVASVILLVGILGLALLQVQAMKGNASARRMTEASNASSDRIEQIMSAVWTDNVLSADLTKNDPDTAGDIHLSVRDGYTVTWLVTDATDSQSKSIDLRVGWMEDGRSHQVSQRVVRTKH